jgi:hypothetical protein
VCAVEGLGLLRPRDHAQAAVLAVRLGREVTSTESPPHMKPFAAEHAWIWLRRMHMWLMMDVLKVHGGCRVGTVWQVSSRRTLLTAREKVAVRESNFLVRGQ